MHHVLSTVFKAIVQIAIVLIVPGGLPAVLIYQYRRLQKRRSEALTEQRPQPAPATDNDKEVLPESPQ